ncbi:hypothetical protein RHECNPAF_4310022 [Rhizobium etli CNPAF512]|nr:hypothetical protein RHECNPAF_4310022 [Rhizobium etli CNPAF512]
MYFSTISRVYCRAQEELPGICHRPGPGSALWSKRQCRRTRLISARTAPDDGRHLSARQQKAPPVIGGAVHAEN